MSSATFDSKIGRNQFLQLFAAQLQHQDPTQPQGQQEFLQQLAQFSTVEGIENLNSGFDGLGKKLDSLIDVSRGSSDLATMQALVDAINGGGRAELRYSGNGWAMSVTQ